ncbi:hypothetical protein [Legionella cardiaca]|uniref:Substrate of the Dot/Icm secretion system n=1 Tax=Legionella cardiaca TaxID=1071983 RepID=A0ABY8AR07_9GAMM|nr:hypothetical protein [Legionella cardiaca]WED42656.1 hypothetical protein PXX05_12215 [Legionella cardiaca]
MELNTRNTDVRLPDESALVKAKEVATTEEAAFYLVDQLEDKLIAARKLDEGRPALTNVREFAEMVSMQQASNSDLFWSGKAGPLSDFQNFQQHIAEKAAATVAANVDGPLHMDFAIRNPGADLLRGYGEHEPETIQALDKLLNAHLAENQIISKGGKLYAGDENGQIRRDSKGEPILADVEKAVQAVKDAGKKISELVKEAGKEIPVTTKQHEYPKEAPQKAPAAAQAVESTPSATAETTPENQGPTAPSA